eukprot:scaffold2007_cov161-Ochromonas_danica.AAC.5
MAKNGKCTVPSFTSRQQRQQGMVRATPRLLITLQHQAPLHSNTPRLDESRPFTSLYFIIGDMTIVNLSFWMFWLFSFLSRLMSCSANSTIWTVNPDKLLPSVFVLPSPHAKHFSKLECDKIDDMHDHSHDILFYCFIVYHYPRAIKTIKSNEAVDLFFYHLSGAHKPAVWYKYDHSPHVQKVAWNTYNEFLRNFTMNNALAKQVDFNLDKTFCIDTHPLETAVVHHISDGLRYVEDIHHFRSDNCLTLNGRDVFIPYVVVPPATSRDLMSNHELFLHRKYVLLAPLREAGGNLEPERLFRTRLYYHLKSLLLEKALISNNMTPPEFDEGMENSLFCLILPGDTPSTAKVYKAIFRGCIPVIFVSFPAQLPFYQFIDWSSFSLIFYKDDLNYPDKIDGIVQTIYNMSRNVDELKRMRVSLAKHAVLFDYSRWEWPIYSKLLYLTEAVQRGIVWMEREQRKQQQPGAANGAKGRQESTL